MPDFVTDQRHIVTLANGDRVPALGQGTWYLGDSRATHDREALALRAGVRAGMTLINTAEMYGNGRSERLIADALDGTSAVGGPLPEHTLENAAADAIELTEEDLALISRDFPAPSHKMPLDME